MIEFIKWFLILFFVALAIEAIRRHLDQQKSEAFKAKVNQGNAGYIHEVPQKDFGFFQYGAQKTQEAAKTVINLFDSTYNKRRPGILDNPLLMSAYQKATTQRLLPTNEYDEEIDTCKETPPPVMLHEVIVLNPSEGPKRYHHSAGNSSEYLSFEDHDNLDDLTDSPPRSSKTSSIV